MPKSLVLAILMHVQVCAYAQMNRTTVAVIEFQNTGGLAPNEVATLSNRFRGILVKTQAYDVVERERMNEILQAQDFNISDACNTAECAVQVGQLLGVQAMIAGDIGKLGETYTIDLRLIDVETSKIIVTETRDYQGKIDGLLGVMEDIAGAFARLRKPAAAGSLDLSSVPTGAQILIDGIPTGQVTPASISSLHPGIHRVELRLGNLLGKREVEIKAGQGQKLNLTLMAFTVALQVLSETAGARIYLDGQSAGKTPLRINLQIGNHEIKLTRRGYEDHTETVTVAENDAAKTLQATMKALPQAARKPVSKMWYIVGGAVVLGGGAAALLTGGGGKNAFTRIPEPDLPTEH